MRNILLAAIGAIAVAAMPTAVLAQPRPPMEKEERKPEPARQQAPKGQQNKGPQAKGPQGNSQYGEWKSAWGKAPPAPPKHWTRKSDWHRHVRACQQRFKSYKAATDTYRTNSGKTVRCKL